jgi:hypothetical protein
MRYVLTHKIFTTSLFGSAEKMRGRWCGGEPSLSVGGGGGIVRPRRGMGIRSVWADFWVL